jgi:hypothetical protein
MKSVPDLYSFVYRGVLTAEAIRLASPLRADEQQDPEDDIRRRMPLDLFDDALILGARKMVWVYMAIATFENSVRAFIGERLLEKVGENWWETAVSADVRRRADERRRDEEQIRWHSSRGTSTLAYVDLGDLALIIQNNHAAFRDLVPTVEWAREIFRSLERSRNVVMHSGQLRITDVERVAMNIRDWVRQVGG